MCINIFKKKKFCFFLLWFKCTAFKYNVKNQKSPIKIILVDNILELECNLF